ncbi:MAG: serpin family protein [Planctomycetota bacterium]
MKYRTRNAFAVCAATALLTASLFTGGVSADEESPKREQATVKTLATAENEFGTDIFKRLHKDGENTFISPVSIATALQMASHAAAGETRSEMDKVLHLEGLDAREANKSFVAALNERKGVKLTMANSLWLDTERVTMKDQYVTEVQEYFGSEVRVANFEDPATVESVNGWISDKTEGLIPSMLNEIGEREIAFLINAIYFKGTWTDQFNKKSTKEADFHLAGDDTKKVNLMSRSARIAYSNNDGVQVAKLPYGDDKQSAMWIILPDEATGLDKLVQDFDIETLSKWQKRTYKQQGTLKLPRFKLKYKSNLNETLKAAGMEQAFDYRVADFKAMGESKLGPIFINRVLHEAVVIVNEEGTEAAAGTIVGVGAGGGRPPEPFMMVCDRPFMFLITDEPTGSILFMGTCYNPADPDAK